MANREILHSLFASFCGGFDIFEQNLFINATHLYLFIILLSLPFIIFMVSNLIHRIDDKFPRMEEAKAFSISYCFATRYITQSFCKHFLFHPSPDQQQSSSHSTYKILAYIKFEHVKLRRWISKLLQLHAVRHLVVNSHFLCEVFCLHNNNNKSHRREKATWICLVAKSFHENFFIYCSTSLQQSWHGSFTVSSSLF